MWLSCIPVVTASCDFTSLTLAPSQLCKQVCAMTIYAEPDITWSSEGCLLKSCQPCWPDDQGDFQPGFHIR